MDQNGVVLTPCPNTKPGALATVHSGGPTVETTVFFMKTVDEQ
jgi:hypothetical protein